MIRIDDDILIDNSLITCAEYQLFLDEMMVRGHYFQPDHWIDLHFPTGQAYAPVLGMRPSDVIAFCDWLTARDTGEWRFRLPTLTEAIALPLPDGIADGLGFWACESADTPQILDFVWAGKIHPTPSYQTTEKLGNHQLLNLDNAFERAREVNSDTESVGDSSAELDLAESRVIYRGLKSDISRLRNLTRSRSRSRGGDFDSELNIAYARVLYRGQNSDLNRVRDLLQEYARNSIRDRIRNIDIEKDIVGALDRSHIRVAQIRRAIEITGDLTRDLAGILTRSHDFELVNDLYSDLLTLKKRIEGSLQPYEGIRIVQERK